MASWSSRYLAASVVVLVLVAGAPALASNPPSEPAAATEPSETTNDQGTPTTEPVFDPTDPEQIFRDIVFPVVGATGFDHGFGACRDGCTRTHNGIDILTRGWKGLPVVAAHDGTVISMRVGGTLSGCSVGLRDDEGWVTRYIHLNTDIPGTDAEHGKCFPPGLHVGERIEAGTLLGWIGDSGNAEETTPHLHFEIRTPDDLPVDPWVSLDAARHLVPPLISTSDLVDVAIGMYRGPVPLAYVVDEEDLERLVPAGSTVTFDAPLIVRTTSAPETLPTALRLLAPNRIVVLTDAGEGSGLVTEVASHAPIVETSPIAAPPPDPIPDDTVERSVPQEEPEAAVDVDVIEAMTYDVVEPLGITVIAAMRGSVAEAEEVASLLADTRGRVIVLIGTTLSPELPAGTSSPDPGANANPSYLWWRTSAGWAHSDSPDAVPSPGITRVRMHDLDPALVAFLTSASTAPTMPYWRDQDTSLATRSL